VVSLGCLSQLRFVEAHAESNREHNEEDKGERVDNDDPDDDFALRRSISVRHPDGLHRGSRVNRVRRVHERSVIDKELASSATKVDAESRSKILVKYLERGEGMEVDWFCVLAHGVR